MSNAERFRLRITGPARQDIEAIDRYTIRTFGEAAALRYLALIRQALRDIGNDPALPGATTRPEAFSSELRFYHLSFSRQGVHGEPVKVPRHFVIYRQNTDDVIEVLRILHDSCDLIRHLPLRFTN